MAETLKEQKAYARTIQVARAEARLAAAQAAGADDDSVAAVGREAALVGAAIGRLLLTGGGWLRMVPDLEGAIWCKWRYTSGRWDGHYSLAVCKPTQSTLSETLIALEHKVKGALLPIPTHKPSPDRF